MLTYNGHEVIQMKLKPKQQKIINEFMRDYVDKSYNTPMNADCAEHTDAHRRTIFEVATLCSLRAFLSTQRLYEVWVHDIVCPTHCSFYRSPSSETEQMFQDLVPFVT